jgi:peptide chain release factor 3
MTDHRIAEQVSRRRTFAIISHPDAGKTTLTEKLLLYSGLIQTAGLVKNRKGKLATSDWMGMEQERGISITSSAMQFDYKGHIINVLDTPGHQDFSEDTYRTLTAADSAIMVLDARKGVEAQTRKLFDVCRIRGIPVLTFINKLDMPGQEPLSLLAEVEQALGIQACAFNWPVGSGPTFQGVVDRRNSQLMTFRKTASGGARKSEIDRIPLDDPRFEKILGSDVAESLRSELELLDEAGTPYTQEAFLQGKVTPAFFGSALTNFGLEPFFDAFLELAPPPSARTVDLDAGGEMKVNTSSPFSGFVFKIQANMDKRHRDCVAFIRICSGRYEPDMMVHHHRLRKSVRLARPVSVMAKERSVLDEAFAGDVVGVIGRDLFHIGDTLAAESGFCHKPLPLFQPEVFCRINPKTTALRKRFDKGMLNLIAEGTVQEIVPDNPSLRPIIAAVGRLQFEVLQYRLEDEYGVPTDLENLPFEDSAWLVADVETFRFPTTAIAARDKLGRMLVLFRSKWDKRMAAQMNPNHELLDMA